MIFLYLHNRRAMQTGSIWKHFLLFLLAPLLALAPLSEAGAKTTSFHSDTIFTSRIKKKLKIDTVQLLRSGCRQCGLGYAMQQVDAFQKTIVAGVKTNPSDTYWIRFVLVKIGRAHV